MELLELAVGDDIHLIIVLFTRLSDLHIVVGILFDPGIVQTLVLTIFFYVTL